MFILQNTLGFSAEPITPSTAPAPLNLFAKNFYISADQRLQNQTYLLTGFAFVETPERTRNTRYSIVTDFGKTMVKTQYLPNLQTLPEIRKWLKESVEYSEFEGVEIKKLSLPLNGKNQKTLYWVGHKSFPTLEAAQQEILMIKKLVEAQGGDLKILMREAEDAFQVPEEEEAVEIAAKLNQQKEEEIALNLLDKLDFGEKLLGPFEGTTAGEPIIWRSFGETSWRRTNLEDRNYNAQVGFWTNQIIFEGFRFPLNTINPMLEVTTNLDSTGIDFKSNMLYSVGLEWRPLQRNPWLQNVRPGGLPILEWLQNIRFLVAYGNRTNLKDEILGSSNHDLQYGVQDYYEWGIGLPPLDQGPANNFSEYLRAYVWGEFFGDYRFSKTGFTGEDDYNAITATSKLLLGFKTPQIPIPKNALMEDLVLMPYMGFEHTINDEFSFPYSNRHLVSAGVRWMPFRNYRFVHNEWLSKVKIYGEWVGVGGGHYMKQDGEADNAIDYDLRFGVNISSNRF